MSEPSSYVFRITPEQAGRTLAAVVRARRPGTSWTEVRNFIERRYVQLNGELCQDSARRVQEGDEIKILSRPARLPESHRVELSIRHLDDHVVVVEKPAGINTVRHPAEREWGHWRRALSPTL